MANVPVSIYNEMFLNGDWVDTTAHVRRDAQIVISGGFANENAALTPSQCQLTLNDADGRYNRRNPLGPYWGSFGKNTPLRNGIRILSDTFTRTETNTWGAIPGGVDMWTNGPGSGGTVAATDWTVSSGAARHSLPVADAYRASDLSKTTRLFIDSEVRVTVTCPVNNVTGTGAIAAEIWFRTLDASNFVALTLLFNTNETTQLGVYEKIANVNRTLLANTPIEGLSTLSTTTYELAAAIEGNVVRAKVWPAGTAEPVDWQVTVPRATVRAGYTAIASFVYAGNSNTKPLVLAYDDLAVRIPTFTGEISDLVPGYANTKPLVRTVQVSAGGILRRIGQGAAPLLSPMARRRGATNGWAREGTFVSTQATGSHNTIVATDADATDAVIGRFGLILGSDGFIKEDTSFTITGLSSAGGFTTVTFTPDTIEPVVIGDQFLGNSAVGPEDAAIAYWPCEDGPNSTAIASGLPGGAPMVIRNATPSFGAENRFLGSAPFLKFNDADLTGPVPDYPNTNEALTIAFLLSMPDADEPATGTDLLQFFTTGTGYSYEIQYVAGTNGDFLIRVTNAAGTLLFNVQWGGFFLRGETKQVIFTLEQVGATVLYTIRVMNADGLFVSGTGSGTVTGVTTLGKITRIAANPGGGYNDVGFGHLTILPFLDSGLNFFDDMRGNFGDRLIHRYRRLCNEEQVPFTYHQDPDLTTVRMGAQRRETLIALLQDGVDADKGLLYNPKSAYALEYRARGALTNQEAFLTLDLEGGELQPSFNPVDDDTNTRNEITVTREGGSSAKAVLEDGPMSVQPPPNGVGRYPQADTIAIASDTDLPSQANWRLHLGTVDEDRYPKITVIAAKDTIPIEKLFSVNIGSRLVITNTADVDIYSDISQLVLGYRLVLNKFVPTFEFNCAPESPYRILQIEDDEYGRADATDSFLDPGMNATDTTFGVATASLRKLWTIDPTDFPLDIMISGELMTVSEISAHFSNGAFWQQNFTVTRSVNGVVKSHGFGEAVQLARPVFYSL